MGWVDGYVGTYMTKESRGVYQFKFNSDTGEVKNPRLIYEAKNAKWLSLCGGYMAFPIEKDEMAGTCVTRLKDGAAELIDEVLTEKDTPCYILQDGPFIYTANYHQGIIMVYSLKNGTLQIVKKIETETEAGCHQILLHGSYLMVPCLKLHCIRIYDRNKDFTYVGKIAFPEGSGPRHGVFNQAHTRLYVVSEWSNELFTFAVEGNEFRQIHGISMLRLNEGEQAAAAAVRMTKDERFLYVSVRGVNKILVFDIQGGAPVMIQEVDSAGVHPRDMILSQDEQYLLAVNRYDGILASMRRDKQSGQVTEVRSEIKVPQGVALALAEKQEVS